MPAAATSGLYLATSSSLCLNLFFLGLPCAGAALSQTRNASEALPVGILGAVGCVTLCYVLMATVLVMLMPVAHMPGGASFAEAFKYAGMGWAKYVVALGACTGIASSLLVRGGVAWICRYDRAS